MAAPPAPLEVEAKLAAANEWDLRAIADLGQLGPYVLRPRGTARLYSIYFDTPELILARHGIALRARRQHRRWETTLKWAGQVHGTIHERPELTESTAPPKRGAIDLSPRFRAEVNALLAGRSPRPVLITDIQRGLRDVFDHADGPSDPLAELALDRVQLRAPEEHGLLSSYCEVEVERKHGSGDDVDQIARLLQQQFELTPSTETKFSHGINLLYGPQLAAFEPPLLDGSLRRLAQRLIGYHLERLRTNDPGARRGEDPEALHAMRVASRRLRAVLRFFPAALPPRRAESLRAELRWLNTFLSPVRDCDVQLQTLERYEGELAVERRQALAPYRDYILGRREELRRAMQEALDSRRYFSTLLRLERFSVDRRPARPRSAQVPAAEAGRESLKHAFRKLRQRGSEAGAMPTPEELHRIRIRAKRLRYLLEALGESSGKPGRRLLKKIIGLQDLLGAHNDAMVAAAFLKRYVNGPGAESSPDTLLTLGGFLEKEIRRARKARAGYHRTWRRFASGKTMSEWRAVQRRLKKEAAAVSARAGVQSPTGARGTK